MFRKTLLAINITLIASLFATSLAYAGGSQPTWETAFDPGTVWTDPYYFVHAVEEFKNDLYIVVGNPGWFDNPAVAGQIFRSPDGKNWEPVIDLGFGQGAVEDACGTNYYDTSWDMTVFQNQLYVFTFDSCGLRPSLILRSSDGVTWEQIAGTDELGLIASDGVNTYYGQFHKFGVFNDMIYASVSYFDMEDLFVASVIFRSPTGAPGTWEKVMKFPGWSGAGSFHVFKGALYVASDWVSVPPDWNFGPEQIWRTFDGVNWEMVAEGFGNPGADSLGGFADYKGYLYVGTVVYLGGSGQIWRTKDGKEWEPVPLDGMGDLTEIKIDGLVVYQGELYAYTSDWHMVEGHGVSVFRTSDAKTWEPVNTPGWGDPNNTASHLEAAQVVYKGDLYIGVVGVQGKLMRMVNP